MIIDHLQAIRQYELSQIIPLIPLGSSICEIGAGAGWQAKELAEQGFHIDAIDILTNPYAAHQVWAVIEYDGEHIPFPDNHFDIIFSSAVLEHIPNPETLQLEINRVLKSAGFAIHILPTSSWRFWTNVTYYSKYPAQVKKILNPFFSSKYSQYNIISKIKISFYRLWKSLFPPRHGERGNALTEIYLFSRLSWSSFFGRTGWRVKAYYPLKLFYTGYSILDSRLSIRMRKILSYIFGNASAIYLLEPSDSDFRRN